MKILVIGGSGVIGWNFIQYLRDKVNIEFTYLKNAIDYKGICLDITQKDHTIKLITQINPDIVINTAAITNVDLCETNNNLANSINVQGTSNIIEGCKKINSKIVYISTSFVFDGKKSQYHEDDTPHPSTYYGFTKFQGEELVKQSGLSHIILRTDQPYCWIEKWQHMNSVIRVLDNLRSGRTHNEVVDWYNTPTYVPDFVQATWKLLQDDEIGIYHLTGPEFINRYDWSLSIADVFGLNKDLIKPITSDSLNLPAKRVNVNLNNNKIIKRTGIQMRGIKNGLLEMYKSRDI